MGLQQKTDLAFPAKSDEIGIDDILRAISEQFDIIMGSEARVAAACAELKHLLPVPLTGSAQEIGRAHV